MGVAFTRERKKVFKRLDEIMRQEEPQDIGMTVLEFAERYGPMSQAAAEGRLERMRKEGKLVAGWSRNARGNRVKVYRPPEG